MHYNKKTREAKRLLENNRTEPIKINCILIHDLCAVLFYLYSLTVVLRNCIELIVSHRALLSKWLTNPDSNPLFGNRKFSFKSFPIQGKGDENENIKETVKADVTNPTTT